MELTLNDISVFIIDCEHKTAPIQDTGYPSIRTPNIGRGNLILEGVNRVSEQVYKEWTKRGEPLEGDLIIAREAPVGNVAIIPNNLKACLGQRTVLVRPNKDLVDPQYLCYLLLSDKLQSQILTKTTGATVAHLNMKDIRELKIPELPSLTHQQTVANVITRYYELIANNIKRIKLLEEMTEEIYNEWFIRFRFPGYEKIKFIDGLPEGWENVRLEDYLKFEKGIEPGSESYSEVKHDDNYLPFLRVGDLGARDNSIFVHRDLLKGKILTKNDIAITLDGTVGLVAMNLSGGYSSGIRKIIYKSDHLKRAFTYYTLLSANIQGTIKAHAAGTTILHAGSSINYMKIVLPIKEVTNEFENIVSKMLDEVICLKDKNKILHQTRDLLLPIVRLVGGVHG